MIFFKLIKGFRVSVFATKVLNAVRAEYPGAHVHTSTFDEFFAAVAPEKDLLPKIVSQGNP